jgi:predicted nucleotidyltransferase
MTDGLPPTIFLAVSGSRAYGTAGPASDLDLRGVCVVPLAARLSLFEGFEQHQGPLSASLALAIEDRLRAHPSGGQVAAHDAECVIFDLAKLVRLCAAANPSALEILFADERDWLIETPQWRRLHSQRHRFLTSKVQQTFQGYAMAQLKRIKTHRGWLLDPPRAKPAREDFGLPEKTTLSSDDRNRIEEAIAAKIRSYHLDDVEMARSTRLAIQERLRSLWMDVLEVREEELAERTRALAGHALNLPQEVMATLDAEKGYRAAMRHWEAYQTWKAQRNPARAALEQRFGYDTKHAMHLVRLMRMGLEVLETGDLLVRRSDAGELRAIREGALSFDRLLAEARDLGERMAQTAPTSGLPLDVDRGAIDALAFELMTC